MNSDQTPATDNSAPTCGERVAEARQSLGLSVADVAYQLRLPQAQIDALERDDVSVFAAPAYARGHLRKYGRLVGIDITDQLAELPEESAMEHTRQIRHKTIKPQVGTGHLSMRVATYAIVAALVSLSAIWTYDDVVGKNETARGAEQDPAALTLASLPASITGTVNQRPDTEGTNPGTIEKSTSTPGIDQGVAAPAMADQIPGSMELTIRFSADSWADVRDGEGKRLLYDLKSKGTTVTLTGPAPMELFIGNVKAVDLWVDGEPYPLSTEHRVARFLVDKG